MHLQLVKEWRRLPVGHVMPDYPDGAGELLIKRGIASVYIDNAGATGNGSNDRADSGASDADRGKGTPKPSKR